MPFLSAKQQIAIKQEATAGSVQALVAANVVLHTGIATWTPNIGQTPREAMTAALSPRGSVPGTQSATITWKQFLRGTATAPVASSNEPDFSVPFKGCGADITVSTPGGAGTEQSSFTPSTTIISDESTGAYCTVALYEDGKRFQIIGAVGNCVITLAVGQPAVAEFTFTGAYVQPTATSLLVPTYPTTISPAFKSSSVTVIDSLAAKFNSFTLDFGNNIVMRQDANSTTGFATAQITSRAPHGSFDPEDESIALYNWLAYVTTPTRGAINLSWGATNYNSFQLNIPNAQYTSAAHADREGIATAPIEYVCCANSDAGNDEWEVVQT